MKLFFLFLSMTIIIGCTPSVQKELNLHNFSKETFGNTIETHNPVTPPSIVKNLVDGDTLYTTVIGEVSNVCQKKGCWMTLKPTGNDDPVFMVRFKNYAFFMPKNIYGDKAIIQGKAYRQITDVKTLRHYAQDAGKSREEVASITLPKEEYIFIADGVEIFRKKSRKN